MEPKSIYYLSVLSLTLTLLAQGLGEKYSFIFLASKM